MKKIISIFVFVLMAFLLFGCMDFKSELSEYKQSAKMKLDVYAINKGEDNYSKENWSRILILVVEGKKEIEETTEKTEVDKAVMEARETIDSVMQNKSEGRDYEMAEFLKQFDLDEPKEFWSGDINEDFRNDSIIVTLRKSWEFPTLEIKNFGLENIEKLEVLDISSKENCRMMVFITLKEHGKENVVDAIKYLEKLAFIKSVEPNHVFFDPTSGN